VSGETGHFPLLSVGRTVYARVPSWDSDEDNPSPTEAAQALGTNSTQELRLFPLALSIDDNVLLSSPSQRQ
jgi:hypothetical protein